MNSFLKEEHKLLRDAVRQFSESEIAPVAGKLEDNEEFSEDLTRKMGEMGLFGIYVSEAYGGHGMDTLSYVIAMEELARVDGSQASTACAHNSLGCGPLMYFGSEEQKQKYLPSLCTGEKVWAFGLTESNAGSDSRGTQTTAKKVGDKWIINGSKIFITNASTSMNAGITVQTKTGEKEDGEPELTCFIVEAGTKGLSTKELHHKLMWRASDTAEVYFDDVEVTDAHILGKQGDGSKQMLQTLDSGKLGIAAMALGAAQGAYEAALIYAKERKQFGRPIADFQDISFKLADMHMQIEHARTYLYSICSMRDAHVRFTKEAAMAKLFCTEMAGKVTDTAIQIHGGYGLIKEYPVERFWRDQRILQIGEGTSEIQRIVISRSILS
jgi:short/branched chain acyl-CoA dehydrogenase